jgi:hypothetical protein
MIDYLIPEDSTRDHTEQHENTRRLANQLIDTPKDQEFTLTYLHRFTIIEAPDCPCRNVNQTAEHILFDCGILQEDRKRLIAAVAKTQLAHKKG